MNLRLTGFEVYPLYVRISPSIMVTSTEHLLERIHNAGLNFLVPINLEETYKMIIDEAMNLVQGEYGSIFIENKGNLERVYASYPKLYEVIPRKKGFTYKVFKTKKASILAANQLAKVHPELKELSARSDIMVPLVSGNAPMGVMSIMSKKDRNFSEEDLTLLKFFGPLASLAIRKAQLYDEIKQALETRDLFISMAAHELRTPLTSVNGYIQLLNMRLGNKDTTEGRWVTQLTYECLRLSKLVEELLTLNNIRTGKLHYVWKEVSLHTVIGRVENNFKFSYPERRLEIINNIPLGKDIVIGDFDKLIQAITNILTNAVKFSAANAKIVMRVKLKAKDISICIIDQGVGISHTELPRIFDKFYRGFNSTREGMGIGLFLTKDIIEKHRGDLKISSKVNVGTKVEIILPKATTRRSS